jgi:hypothetical protein
LKGHENLNLARIPVPPHPPLLAQELAQDLALANSRLPHWTPVQHRRFRTNRCHVSTAKRCQRRGSPLCLLLHRSPMRYLPDDNLSYPVLIAIGQGVGSGFFCNTADKSLLVTAKHVISDGHGNFVAPTATLTAYDKGDLSTKLEFQLDFAELKRNGHVRMHQTADVAVVELGSVEQGDSRRIILHPGFLKIGAWPPGKGLIGCPVANFRKADDVLISNPVYLFGYPVSLGHGLQLDKTRPLLRRGIVAGKTNDGKIVLDCPVYFGNSGGLAIQETQLSLGNYNYSAIGLAVQFVPFIEEIFSKQFPGNVSVRIENSGYSIVEPMDRVLELL